MVSTTATGNAIATAGLTTATVISGSNPSAITGASLVQILVYTRYMNISRSSRLEATFVGFKVSSGVIDTQQTSLSNQTKDKFQEKSSPPMFENYGISPTFLVNFWAGVVSLLIISGVVLIVMAIYWKISRVRINIRYIEKLFKILKDNGINYLVSQFYNSYGDVMLFAGLEFRSSRFTSTLSVVSFAMAIIFSVLGIIILVLHAGLLRKYQLLKKEDEKIDDTSQKKLEKFKISTKGVKTLYGEFKDESIYQQSFLIFLIIRSMLCGLCLSLLYSYPLVQTIILNVLFIIFLGYVVMIKPFDDIIDQVQQVFFEAITVLVNVSLLYIAVLDHQGNTDENKRYVVGEIFMQANMLAQFVPTGFLVVKIAITAREFYKKFKNRKRGKVSSVHDATSLAKVAPLELPPRRLLHDRIQSFRASVIKSDLASPHNVENSNNAENSEVPFGDESPFVAKKSSTIETPKNRIIPRINMLRRKHTEKSAHGFRSPGAASQHFLDTMVPALESHNNSPTSVKIALDRVDTDEL